MPEFVPDWLEEEMKRNGLDMSVRPPMSELLEEGALLTEASIREAERKVVTTVGAAEVAFQNPYDVFDVEEPVNRQSPDEHYSAPTPRPAVEGTGAEKVLLAQVANVLTAIEQGKPYEEMTDGEKFGRDAVTLPHHYARYAIEPIRFAVENNLNFLQANIVKYILRFDAKNGMEDLNKAERYLTLLKRFAAKDPDWWRP